MIVKQDFRFLASAYSLTNLLNPQLRQLQRFSEDNVRPCCNTFTIGKLINVNSLVCEKEIDVLSRCKPMLAGKAVLSHCSMKLHDGLE